MKNCLIFASGLVFTSCVSAPSIPVNIQTIVCYQEDYGQMCEEDAASLCQHYMFSGYFEIVKQTLIPCGEGMCRELTFCCDPWLLPIK